MIGIDFGTSNTVVTVSSPTGPRLVKLHPESFSIPTVLFVEQGHPVKIGFEARQAYINAAQNSNGSTFRFFQAIKLALKDPDLKSTNLFGRPTDIEKIVSLYLGELRRKMEVLGLDTSGTVVVGRPVSLADDPVVDQQVQKRFETAFLMAGFEKVVFIPEPVAASVDLVGSREGRVLLFDFGGGTLDISVSEIQKDQIHILGNVGIELGGTLLDEDFARERIQGHFGHMDTLVNQSGTTLTLPHYITSQVISYKLLPFDQIREIKRTIKDLIFEAKDKRKLHGLLDFLEKNRSYDLFKIIDDAKIKLSTIENTFVDFTVPPHIQIHEDVTLSQWEKLIAPRVEQAKALVYQALEKVNLGPKDIDLVIRVGGSSLIPAFARMLEDLFPGRLGTGDVFNGISLGLLPAYQRGFKGSLK